jgi:hypothetical protein
MRAFLENAGFLATNLAPISTGVQGAVVWIFSGEPTLSEATVGPRILVVVGESLALASLSNAVAVRLSRPPAVMGALPVGIGRQAVRFADANGDLLRRYWRGRMSTRALLDQVERV